MIFLLNSQENPALFMQKTEQICLENWQFHSGLLLELFKNGKFFQNLNLRIFRFLFFFEYLENRSRYFYISKSSEFVMV